MFQHAEIIHSYSRRQAIADGVLIDVTEAARAERFALPMAFTSSVYALAVLGPAGSGDAPARLGEVLSGLHRHVRGNRLERATDRLAYDLPMPGGTLRVILHCGPGDDGEPVLTVMQPDED